jgi:cobaltochelatase CobN
MILYLTNAPSEILGLRAVIEALPDGFPPVRAASPLSYPVEPPDLDGVDVVLVRLLGGRAAWSGPFAKLQRRCEADGVGLLAFGGEAAPDAELTEASTVAGSIVAQAFEYLVHGGLANLEHLLRFVVDTVCFGGFGFEAPVEIPAVGVYHQGGPGSAGDPEVPDRPRRRGPSDPSAPSPVDDRGEGPHVAVLFYRAHLLAGNTGFVDDLCAALEARGARSTALWCYSLRPDAEGNVAALELVAENRPDAVITTVLVSGSAAGNGSAWDASALGGLGVPIVQAVTATSAVAEWEASPVGLTPIDVAMRVALPEFDGRIISVPFSFNEEVDDGDELGTAVSAYRCRPDRTDAVVGLAVRLAKLRSTPPPRRRVAIVLSAYPTKRSRIGNAVALDTPASVLRLLGALRAAGYQVDRIPGSSDELMAELIDAFSYEVAAMSAEQRRRAPGRFGPDEYEEWWRGLSPERRDELESAWGPPPGDVYRDPDGGDLVFAGLDLGGVLVTVQPPRGFGENPVAVYHSPDLPPTHHYLAFYRWLDQGWGADAVVHVGKHGTLEWLPGKSVGLSDACYPDLALGDLPLVYPFVVNDPGEGTQAKRRAHAVIVDHLVPPMTRADTYDDIARLERLLDEHAQIASLDPAKLPAIRERVWDLLVAADIHRDLGLDGRPSDGAFDDLVNHVDGYLCELKDAQIRGGLHVLGRVPEGEALIDLVLALTRLPQAGVPSLRSAVGARLEIAPDDGRRSGIDRLEAECRRLVEDLASVGWGSDAIDALAPSDAERAVLRWVGEALIPALGASGDEIRSVLAALDGRWVPPGPSGAPTRGMAHVLPTGRNFYSVDPQALPTVLSWDVGRSLAERMIERHIAEEGRPPSSVGLVIWGTAAMRTGGDDVALALALLGVRPRWQPESGRVTGIELVPESELGRPRVDVVVRISGFFRDAFPHLVTLLDDAIALAGVAADGDPRIFGAKPGAYGSGILALIDSRNWRSDEDLAAVYLAWGGYSYGRAGMGLPAAAAMQRRFVGIEIALKSQDNREHDIFDSDDYLQDHGGMIATIRALRGSDPKAWFADSADPSRPRVRSLSEEAARVVRTRVLNPKWIGAMTRHGYKGAFELAATVDYLFGYDATAHVVEDWMYERVTEAYVADPEIRKFLEQSNPWALRSMAERLLEAADRGLWAPSSGALDSLRSALVEGEGWEEGR